MKRVMTLAVVLVIGCGQQTVKPQEEETETVSVMEGGKLVEKKVKKPTDWIPPEQKGIDYVKIGMNEQEVLKVMGQPASKSRNQMEWGIYDNWQYGRVAIGFRDGKVRNISQ